MIVLGNTIPKLTSCIAIIVLRNTIWLNDVENKLKNVVRHKKKNTSTQVDSLQNQRTKPKFGSHQKKRENEQFETPCNTEFIREKNQYQQGT